MAQRVKRLPAIQKTWVQSLGWEDPLGKGKGYPLQFSGLENSMQSMEVAKSRTRLTDFHFHFALIWLIAQLVKNLPAIPETRV